MQDFPLRLTKSFLLSHLGDHPESRGVPDFLLVRELSQNQPSKNALDVIQKREARSPLRKHRKIRHTRSSYRMLAQDNVTA